MKFIHFGCWNEFGYKMEKQPNDENTQLQYSALTYTIDQLNKYVDKNPTEFIIIAGDNFYPPKNKDKNKDKNIPNADFNLFFSGFKALPKIQKYLIFGNHDIDDQIKINKSMPYYELFPNLTNISSTDCKILNLQQLYTSNKSDYTVFDDVLHREYNSTLIIMLDSNLLDQINWNFDTNKPEPDKGLGCYKYLFKEFFKLYPDSNISQLVGHQIYSIINLIDTKRKNKNIKNIIFVAHHPIFTYKHKTDKDTGERILKKETNRGLINFFKIMELEKVLINIDITYLCADLHLYQYGIVNIGGLTIKQYVVGTGGAHQDTYDFKGSSETQYKDIDNSVGNNYQVIQNYNNMYGFLVVNIETNESTNVQPYESTDVITYQFIPVDFSKQLDGGGIRYINLI